MRAALLGWTRTSMQVRIRIWAALAALGPLASFGLLPELVQAEEPTAAEASSQERAADWGNWTPSISLGITILDQRTRATTHGFWHVAAAPTYEDPDRPTSHFEADCDGPGGRSSQCVWITELGDHPVFTVPDGIPFGIPFYKRDHVDGAAIPFTLELLAPAFLPELLGVPRPFVEASYSWPQESNSQVARASSGGITPNNLVLDLPRMQLDVKLRHLWSTGIGVAFATELGGYPLEIRPSIHYFGQQATLTMRSQHAGHKNANFPPDPPNDVRSNSVVTSATKDEVYHGVGPRLALDVEIGRRGPIAFHLISGIYFAYFPGDVEHLQKGLVKGPTAGLGGNPPFTPEPIGSDTYEFKFSRWQPGGSIALRVAWVGFSE
jgi:hypothetical protein